ncbi:MAG TPA: hypothetical protein VFC39_21870 [Acidobacteriaceae bacterium]|nr:hypothetical protein [Acidobacteriaceae bacterium]
MKITIESTDILTEIDGAMCRVWRGVTERGVQCDLAIAMLRVLVEADHAEFQAELASIPPSQLHPRSFREKF